MPQKIRTEMGVFIDRIKEDPVDLQSLGIDRPLTDMLDLLSQVYGVEQIDAV